MTGTIANPLEALKLQLKKIADKPFKHKYYVPSLWVEAGKEPLDGMQPVSVNPGKFFLSHIEAIEKNSVEGLDPLRSLNQQIPGGEGGSWINNQAIYNMFVNLGGEFLPFLLQPRLNDRRHILQLLLRRHRGHQSASHCHHQHH